MFSRLREQWQIARAEVLRQEFEDFATHMLRWSDLEEGQAMSVVSREWEIMNSRGRLRSTDARRAAVKALRAEMRRTYPINPGRAGGLFVLAAFVEASYLPGENAEFVYSCTKEIVLAGEREIALRSCITSARQLGAKTPREAAEIVNGGPLSDEDWAKVAGRWESAW